MVEKTLRVEGEDFFFDGDLRLVGKNEIQNGSLIVTGDLVFAETVDKNSGKTIFPSLEITNGNLSASRVWIEDTNCYKAPDDRELEYFSVDGDIYAIDFNIGDTDIVDAGDIVIEDTLYCGNIINAFSAYVGFSLACRNISTLSDIFCGNHAEVYGDTTCGGALYAEGYYDCHENNISVKGPFNVGELYHAGKVEVG